MFAHVPDALSPEEAAKVLGLEIGTIRQLRRLGTLDTVLIDHRTKWVTRASVLEYQLRRKPRGRPKKHCIR